MCPLSASFMDEEEWYRERNIPFVSYSQALMGDGRFFYFPLRDKAIGILPKPF